MKQEVGHREYVFIVGSHGNEMKIGKRLYELSEDNFFKTGILLIKGNSGAIEEGKRYLGTGEIMGRYPGSLKGDNEQVTAARNLAWIRYHRPLVVFDMHENTAGRSNFGVGRKTTIASIAGARLLNKNIGLVEESKFYEYVPNGTTIENSVVDEDPNLIAEQMYNGFIKIKSTHLSEASFEETMNGVRFYQKFEISSVGQDGHRVPYLEALEEVVPHVLPQTPFDLPHELRRFLSIPPDAQIAYGSWGHNNMSNQVPDRLGYTDTGTPRREYFGSFLIRVAPPISLNRNAAHSCDCSCYVCRALLRSWTLGEKTSTGRIRGGSIVYKDATF